MPSRRSVLVGSITAGTVALAGCLGDDGPTAHCSSYSEIPDGEWVRDVGPVGGEREVSLGIVVSPDAPTDDAIEALHVRDVDGDLLESVPLRDNRDMSELDPADEPKFDDDGELYAVPLGPRPQHAILSIEVVDADGEVLETVDHRFNCYDPDGELP